MSQWLITEVPPKRAMRLLQQIDAECEKAAASDTFPTYSGPFGVFRVVPNASSVTKPANEILSDLEFDLDVVDESVPSHTEYPVDSCVELTPWTPAGFPPDAGSRDSNIVSNLDFFDIDPTSSSFLAFTEFPPNFPLPQNCSELFPGISVSLDEDSSPSSISSLTSNPSSVPSNAVFLLQHYSTSVIGALTPFRHSKTPWHVLFLPYVRQCLAAMMLNEKLGHAGLCAFNGALALSALSLEGHSRSQTWFQEGVVYSQRARQHARVMLKTAYDTPKTEKYKSILMALITLVHVSIFSDDRDETEVYLLEAEKFIRLRGMKRRKSRKVRMLHHCYAFTRMFHESLSFSSVNMTLRHQVRHAIESSGLVVSGSDVPVFRINGWHDWTQEMNVLKSQEEEENDMHLERPGIYPDSLYPEIFGMPAEWLLLLSQVIRLGNEKDDAEQPQSGDPLGLRDFMDRAKAIERSINNLHLSDQFINSFADERHIHPSVVQNMFEALRESLAIYFYRRIYNLESSLLQPRVQKASACLLRIQTMDAWLPYGSVGFIWPAFIAACEAEDQDTQLSLLQWFEHYAQKSGLPTFTNALEIVRRVWQERRDADGANTTWLDLVRRDQSLRKV